MLIWIDLIQCGSFVYLFVCMPCRCVFVLFFFFLIHKSFLYCYFWQSTHSRYNILFSVIIWTTYQLYFIIILFVCAYVKWAESTTNGAPIQFKWHTVDINAYKHKAFTPTQICIDYDSISVECVCVFFIKCCFIFHVLIIVQKLWWRLFQCLKWIGMPLFVIN